MQAFFRKEYEKLVPAFTSEWCHFDRLVCDNRRGICSQADTNPITCINIRLDSLSLVGSPGYSFVTRISPYWVENPAALQFLDIPYNITSVKNAQAFRNRVDASLRNIARFVSCDAA